MVLLSMIGLVAILITISIRFKMYLTSARLVNMPYFDQKIKWDLITKWGP